MLCSDLNGKEIKKKKIGDGDIQALRIIYIYCIYMYIYLLYLYVHIYCIYM